MQRFYLVALLCGIQCSPISSSSLSHFWSLIDGMSKGRCEEVFLVKHESRMTKLKAVLDLKTRVELEIDVLDEFQSIVDMLFSSKNNFRCMRQFQYCEAKGKSSGLAMMLPLHPCWLKGPSFETTILSEPPPHVAEPLDLEAGYFSLRQIKDATNDFDPANKIGHGRLGPVYKGVLSDGVVIAVRQVSPKSKSEQGSREFINEIGMISALQHPNVVKLYRCCMEGNQLLVVHEYIENISLAQALFGPEGQRIHLDWPTRVKICQDIARGLAYLHEESKMEILHMDMKSASILLDKDLNAKISDFGLAKLDYRSDALVGLQFYNVISYMAPECPTVGPLSDKADVYSFGVVTLEIVSGKSLPKCMHSKGGFTRYFDSVHVLREQGRLLELVDPHLGSSYSQDEAMRMLHLALWCTNQSHTLRPSMSSVVSILEGKTPIQA